MSHPQAWGVLSTQLNLSVSRLLRYDTLSIPLALQIIYGSSQSFSKFCVDDGNSNFTSSAKTKTNRSRKLSELGQSAALKVIERPLTTYPQDAVDLKPRVSSEHLHIEQLPLDSMFTSTDIAEDISRLAAPPSSKDSPKDSLFIRIKRKLPSEEAIDLHLEKRRRSESLNAPIAEDVAKKSNEFTGWDSDLTEFSSMDDDDDDDGSETEIVGCLTLFHQYLTHLWSSTFQEQRAPSGVVIRIPSLSSRLSSNTNNKSSSNPQAKLSRVCAIRSCKNPLPDIAKYKYKLCKPCRVHLRDYQRSRVQQNQRQRQSLPKDGRTNSETDSPAHSKQSSKSLSPSKRNLLFNARAKHASRLPLRMFLHTPMYPEYQNLPLLLNSFAKRSRDFMDAFMVWQQLSGKTGSNLVAGEDSGMEQSDDAKLGEVFRKKPGLPDGSVDTEVFGGNSNETFIEEKVEKVDADSRPISFSFEGEYSIIASKELIPGPKGIEETWQRTGRIVEELERVSGLEFK